MEFKILKKLSENRLVLDGVRYKPYFVGYLPPSFGRRRGEDGQDTIGKWFNHKGLTYLEDK